MFRTNQPDEREIEAFHRDGYIAYKDVMEDDYREALIEEVLSAGPVFKLLAENPILANAPWHPMPSQRTPFFCVARNISIALSRRESWTRIADKFSSRMKC